MKQLLVCILAMFGAFHVSAQSWIQAGRIEGEAAGDAFGSRVALSADGSRLVVGAPSNEDNGLNAGQVRVYEHSAGTWNQLGADIDGEASYDLNGWSVSISADGSRIAAGALFHNGSGVDSGAVRIFEYSSNTWIQLGGNIDGVSSNDACGSSVSLSADGNRVAVGAYNNNDNGVNSGHVRIFEYIGGAWNQLGGDIDGEASGDFCGTSVSLSANGFRVAIGSSLNNGNGEDSGQIRVYEYSGNMWNQLGADIDGEAAGDQFGTSISLSADGNRVAAGAYKNDGNGTESGHARIFEYSGGMWSQLGADIDGEAAGDHFGCSISLSGDGNRMAVGAYSNSGNGSDSGHVRIFDYTGGSWSQYGDDLDGEATGDWSGRAVAFCMDGTHVAIGSPANYDNRSRSGHVRIFQDVASIDLGLTLLYLEVIGGGTAVELSYETLPGVVYQIQTTTSLSPGVWHDVGDAQEGDGSVHSLQDSTMDADTKTYRIKITGP